MFENFETNLDEYFYNMTYHSLDTLRQEDEEYKALYDEHLSIGEDLETIEDEEDTDNLKELINDFIDVCSELRAYENEYLYKKGYCDCLKLFRYLENL